MLFNLGSKLVSGAIAAASVGIVGGGVSARMFSVSAQTRDNIYQFSARDIDGHQVKNQIFPPSSVKGKGSTALILLILNIEILHCPARV